MEWDCQPAHRVTIDVFYFKKTAQTAHPINSATLKDRILYKKRIKKYFKNGTVYGMGSLVFSLYYE